MITFAECFKKNGVSAKRQDYPAGVSVFSEGDNADGMYFIESGVVRIARKMPLAGGEISLALLEQEEFFGIISFLTGSARMADAMAVTDCCLWQVDKKTFHEAVTRSPEFAGLVIRGLLKRLEELHIKMKDTTEQVAVFTQRMKDLSTLWHSLVTWSCVS